jgi:hypothetical protein
MDAVPDHPAEGAATGGDHDRGGPAVQLGEQVVGLTRGVPGEGGQPFTGRGQAEPASVPLVQLDAETGPQFADLRVQRGLAQVQGGRRGGEVQVVGEHPEGVRRVGPQELPRDDHGSTIGQPYGPLGNL